MKGNANNASEPMTSTETDTVAASILAAIAAPSCSRDAVPIFAPNSVSFLVFLLRFFFYKEKNRLAYRIGLATRIETTNTHHMPHTNTNKQTNTLSIYHTKRAASVSYRRKLIVENFLSRMRTIIMRVKRWRPVRWQLRHVCRFPIHHLFFFVPTHAI